MVYTAMGLPEREHPIASCGSNNWTYLATFWLTNRSLTLPPATLRNAELQKPVMKRKTRKVAWHQSVSQSQP